MSVEPILISGEWRRANAAGTFHAEDPSNRQPLSQQFPVSAWEDCDAALDAAVEAADTLRTLPVDRIAAFLSAYADSLDRHADEICDVASRETGLPVSPRLKDVELPRTVNQLHQAAAAAAEQTWRRATIDGKANIRSYYAALGTVCVFGPNNFPLAFNSIAGGDFAAAIASGNAVIAKANSSHPGVTKLLAECAVSAADANELPKGSVQLLYRTSHQDGERLAADPRTGAIAYTGSRGAGLRLKSAADAAGTPIYLELSSVNPVLLLPAIVAEKFEELVQEFAGSCLLAAGQFCTCPNMVLLLAGVDTERFITRLADEFASRPSGTLLSGGVLSTLQHVLADLRAAGAQLAAGGGPSDGPGYSFQNTLLRVSGGAFLENPESLQSEAFGNVTTVVVAEDVEQLGRILRRLEGSLTGSVYSLPDHDGDEQIYRRVEPLLRQRVGRLLNDKMPTGVAVSPGMNHGGPFPATGHPGFTAVGIPAALDRFAMLQCYDNVRSDRLPACLQDANPNGRMWRQIDGTWTQAHVG